MQRIENALKSISNAFWNVANAFQRKRNALQIHFKCILKTLSMRRQTPNTDNAFNETAAGRLESFREPLLLVEIFTMNF